MAAVEAARVAAEAEAARVAEENAKAAQTAPAQPVTVASGDGWQKLRDCEAGGDYTKNTGNGYYGSYQYDIGTWNNYGGYRLPSDAPPAVQDAKAHETFAARGSSPWPSCGRFL